MAKNNNNNRNLLARQRDEEEEGKAWRVHPVSSFSISKGPSSSSRRPMYHHHQRNSKKVMQQAAHEDELMGKTVKELKDQLRQKGMPVSGIKAHLVARLLDERDDSSPQAA